VLEREEVAAADVAAAARRTQDQDEDIAVHRKFRERVLLAQRRILRGLEAGRHATHDLVEALPPVDLLQLGDLRDAYRQDAAPLALSQDFADVREQDGKRRQ